MRGVGKRLRRLEEVFIKPDVPPCIYYTDDFDDWTAGKEPADDRQTKVFANIVRHQHTRKRLPLILIPHNNRGERGLGL